MDESIRLRRPEDGPSPYCAQSAQPLLSGPESSQQAVRGAHEHKATALRGGKRIGQRAAQATLTADGA